MKVLNLRCGNGHGFEGWFGSEEDFMNQNGRGLVQCPLCADHIVTRTPTAPRLNLGGAKAESPASNDTTAAPVPAQQMQAAWLKAMRHVLENTEDVGDRFAAEARRIHYGEAPMRGIRGKASAEQREGLHDEGIEVVALPLPAGLDGPAH
jgi:hypothetical protein